jgi:hypothetical protein
MTTDLEIPPKVEATAYNINSYKLNIARYYSDYVTILDFSQNTYLTPLLEHLETEKATMITGLYAAADAAAAYAIITGVTDAWLDANVTDGSLNTYLKAAIDGLINPAGDFIGLLFTQDSDLLGYEGSNPCVADTGVYDFSVSEYNWEIDYDASNNGTPVYSPGCCFQITTDEYPVTPCIFIRQTVPHDVETIRITTWDALTIVDRLVIIYTSDTLEGPRTEVAQRTSDNGEWQTTINVVNKFIHIRAQCFGANDVRINHVEYINS